MTLILIAFGVLIALAGMVIITKPSAVYDRLKEHIDSVALHIAAVVVRVIVGTLMVLQASSSAYPIAVETIGWLGIGAALILALIGRDRFKRLMSWALSLRESLARAGGVVALGFGVFIVHAFI